MPQINKTVVMSGTENFHVLELNPQSHENIQPDITKAAAEHATIRQFLEGAGVNVIKVDTPMGDGLQDAVYTANWALCRGNRAIMARLPNMRQNEEQYARKVLENLGKTIITAPQGLKFSGQGDALPCGNYLFAGSNYRSDQAVHRFISETLSYNVISLQTIPNVDVNNQPIINHVTGWPDSFFYDIDLAISVLTPTLIAWCPAAFMPESQAKIRAITDIEKIEVSFEEAKEHFACNLISTGETVVMSSSAPKLRADIEAHGLKTVTPVITELAKGGGYIRCTTLTLDNI